MEPLILTSAHCGAVLDASEVIEALARMHLWHARGMVTQPLPVVMPLSRARPGALAPRAHGHGAHGGAPEDSPAHVLMAATAPELGLTVVKTLLDAPANRLAGRPAQRSVVTAYSTDTGECVAILDGAVLTRVRTAAATALATRTLARPDATRLGLLGAGALAREHVRALRCVMDVREVSVWSRSADSAHALGLTLAEEGLSVRVTQSVADVAEHSDVLCTLTPSRQPLLHARWLRPGLHVNAIGSPPRPGFRELASDVFARASRVVVDHRGVALAESQNIRSALEDGLLRQGDLVELGEVLMDAAEGPVERDPLEVTVYNSVGIGLQDLAAVALILERAPSGDRDPSAPT